MRKRILTIFIIFILLFSSLVIRLGYITFISSNKITKLANLHKIILSNKKRFFCLEITLYRQNIDSNLRR